MATINQLKENQVLIFQKKCSKSALDKHYFQIHKQQQQQQQKKWNY